MSEVKPKVDENLSETWERLSAEIRGTLQQAGLIEPTPWYIKIFLAVFNVFTRAGFALAFVIAVCLAAPVWGLMKGGIIVVEMVRDYVE